VTVREVLSEAYGVLRAGRVDTPVLDATVLLSEALGVRKERMLADLPETVPPSSLAAFRSFLDMRLRGIPVSYIRRRKEFWGLEFMVDERVLVPRPETEILVEHVLALARQLSPTARLHDACTGSGCIAIACAHELPALVVSVSDLSPDALAVCRSNASRLLGRELDSRISDLLEGVCGPFDIVTANPPYLTSDEVARMRAEGWPEPELALSGGPDGTALARRLIPQARGRLAPGGSLFLEIAPAQAGPLGEELERSGFAGVRAISDFSGRSRVLTGRAA
jgi:release factor glutamine methyltransferase